jgi:hypothetical protein
MAFSADRVLRAIRAAQQLQGEFPVAFVRRLCEVASDYVRCTNWLEDCLDSDHQVLPSLHRWQQHLLRHEMEELCCRFEEWLDFRVGFDLFPQASAQVTLLFVSAFANHPSVSRAIIAATVEGLGEKKYKARV